MKRSAQTILLTLRALLNGLLTVVLFGVPLFLPAGSLRYWNAWLFLAVFVVGFVSILIYFTITNPQYAEKRFQAKEHEGAQRIVMALLVFCALAMLVVAGLNFRFQWSSVPLLCVVAAAVVMAGALAFVFVAMKENAFASRIVVIQEDQKLVDTGTYSIVRHPMYLGFSVLFCVAPVVLGALYSLIPAVCISILLSFRIRNEEQVLGKGLRGYGAYAAKVKYRLIPFVW